MRYLRSLALLAVVSLVGVASADATPILYDMAVTITIGPAPYLGQTYTGTFVAETTTGQVTNFQANLLGVTFVSANLGNVATFDAANNVTRLTFHSAFDGTHNIAFTDGVSGPSVTSLGLNPNNFFAFFDRSFSFQGGGTPRFSVAAATVPEPASLTLLGLSFAGFAAARRRRA